MTEFRGFLLTFTTYIHTHTYIHVRFCYLRGELYKISLYRSQRYYSSSWPEIFSAFSLSFYYFDTSIISFGSYICFTATGSPSPTHEKGDSKWSRFILTVVSLFLFTDSGLTPALLPVASGSSLCWLPLHLFIHQPICVLIPSFVSFTPPNWTLLAWDKTAPLSVCIYQTEPTRSRSCQRWKINNQ